MINLQASADLAFHKFGIRRTDVEYEVENLTRRGLWGHATLMGKHIQVRPDLSDDKILEVLAHEIAHSRHVCHTGWHCLMTKRIHQYLREVAK